MAKLGTTGILAAACGMMAIAMPASAAPAFSPAGQVAAAHTGVEAPMQHSRYENRRDYRRSYNRRAYYGEPVYRNTRVWRGRDGRYYCRKKNGTTGLIVGGAVGALLGREIDSRGDRSLGTILGAAGGALLGREVDRGGSRCR